MESIARLPLEIPEDECRDLTERDIALLDQIDSGLAITADVSRSDILLCVLSVDGSVLVLRHAAPNSISSLYRQDATGRKFPPLEQPLIWRVLKDGSSGRLHKQILADGAPVIQDVFPIQNAANRVIGVMAVETNMIEHERQRRRNRHFRAGLNWLQRMAVRGEIENAHTLSGFGPYDGIYLATPKHQVVYLSGVAANLFRTIERVLDFQGNRLEGLEVDDERLVEQAFQTQRCVEKRYEYDDGRVWVRTAIPLRAPPASWQRLQQQLRLPISRSNRSRAIEVDAVLVLIHNATESVAKERELKVKSAMIQEIHHRVKNNLQTMAAILRMQSRRTETEEAKQVLIDAVNRVLSMSVIHEFLSQDSQHPINIKDVCRRVADQVEQVLVHPEQRVAIQVEGTSIRLRANQATAVALVINELLLNAIEHGLQNRREGKVTITLADLGDAVQISVRDNGAGLPSGFNLDQTMSLGLQIVKTLITDDLKGELSVAPAEPLPAVATDIDSPGTEALIHFPK